MRVISRQSVTPTLDQAVAIHACMVGAGLSGGFVAALAPRSRLDVIDPDVAEPGQDIIPPLSEPGLHKAESVHRYRAERFPWLDAELAIVAEAEAVGDGYWRRLASEGGVLLACTDSIATQSYLAAVAARHGLPFVATGLGPAAAEVFVSPPGDAAACYACLGRDPEQPRTGCFLRGLEATVANRAQPPPTNSQPHIAALAAAVALASAGELAAREPAAAELVHLDPAGETERSRVERRADCPVCSADPPPQPDESVRLPLSSEDSFGEIQAALNTSTDAEVILPRPAARVLFCSACEAITEVPHMLLGRWMSCAACGSDDIVAGEIVSAGGPVALAPVRDLSPRALGWPWWPVLELVDGGRRLSVELCGDAAEEGLVHVAPLTVGGEPRAL
ncbi:MAG: hypothetical protein U9R79_03225 [Armatimonadota bacterium]|nr:hypothetical protein [Armatimonadota bacterium]